MDSIILHISDLHVSLENKIEGERVNEDSYLKIPNSKESSSNFIDKFIVDAKGECSGKKVYLLVTGDITDCGAKLEFEYAFTYLNRIISELDIDKNNILLIPGDHDIYRKSIEELQYSKENITVDETNLTKFVNFAEFYLQLLEKEFDSNKIIFDTLNFEDKILLLGVNSCYNVDLNNIEGKLDIEKFKCEIPLVENPMALNYIVCCHHNITSSFENKNSGQWEKENRLRFIKVLEENEIRYIFSGNEHTSSCKSIMGDLTISDSGTLSSNRFDSAFKIYELINSEDIILKNRLFGLQKTGVFDDPFYWQHRDNIKARQDEFLKISLKNPPPMETEPDEILASNIDSTDLDINPNSETDSGLIQFETNIYTSEFFTTELYEKVKNLKLFHSGHFHWSESSRAHNWIDVSKLIENKDDLTFLKNAIVDVIEDKNLKDVDLIIGLGYEGNIISSKAAIKYNKPYSFLPYSYRHDEHHEFENELNFNNDEGHFKKVLIITDVVNDGRTIRKLINKREKQKAFFKNVDQVYVISLFYTGSSDLNSNILNYDFVKTIPKYDIENDEEVNNIEFYTVKKLEVEKCPYGEDFREKCLIVKDNLGCVNLFYDESKYLDAMKTNS